MAIKKKTIVTAMAFIYIIYKLMKSFLASNQEICPAFSAASDLANLPPEIKITSNFCLWQYGISVNGKAPKIPYRYNAMERKIVKGLGDYRTHLIVNYKYYSTLLSSGVIDSTFFLGLSLPDSNLSVIDIDDFYSHPILDQTIRSLFEKGCYIEASPSGQGLHIFYQGACDWSYGRNRSVKSLDDLPTTCEVYSFHDKRFITLTGRALKYASPQENRSMPEADMISEELQTLQELFFTAKEKSSLVCSDILKTLPSYDLVDALTARRLTPFLLDLVKRIENSNEFVSFEQLCLEEKPSKYSSPSEADMAFAGIIARAADLTLSEEDQKQILHMAFERYRCQRPKLQERPNYVARTISKTLDNTSYVKPKRQIQEQDPDIISGSRQSSKSSIVKVCNTMKIFHFGRTVQSFSYNSNEKGNELNVVIPQSLNQQDFKYFAELMFQYVDAVKEASKNYELSDLKNQKLPINMKQLFRDMDTASGGSRYKALLKSLKKLGSVMMHYTKTINKGKKIVYAANAPLLLYRYESDEHSEEPEKKRLSVQMHPIVIDMAFSSDYNYALLNKDSYRSLDSDKTKLLYYHFCLATLPGDRAVTFFADELLELWPKSAATKQLKYKRKKELLALLENIIEQIDQGKIQDLSVTLVYSEDDDLESVIVKKHHLRLT